jgi:hypothetical protein
MSARKASHRQWTCHAHQVGARPRPCDESLEEEVQLATADGWQRHSDRGPAVAEQYEPNHDGAEHQPILGAESQSSSKHLWLCLASQTKRRAPRVHGEVAREIGKVVCGPRDRDQRLFDAPTTTASRGFLRCVTTARPSTSSACAAPAGVPSTIEAARPIAQTLAASVASASDSDRPKSSSSALPAAFQRGPSSTSAPSMMSGFLGQQRCDDCGVFGRRLGPGGPCPHCDEAVAISDLLAEVHSITIATRR